MHKIILLLLLPSMLFCQKAEVDTYRLFFLGGQSNMEGYGYSKDLPASLNKTIDDVWIFHGNTTKDEEAIGGMGIWETLKPGHGVNFSTDEKENKLSDRFGIEMSFALKMKELYPGEKIAIIKYAKGGSSIDSLAGTVFGSWEPDFQGNTGINQYDHFLATMNNAFAIQDINGDGVADKLIPSGILWMQGETDATFDEALAERYYDNLKRLMDLIRATLRTDDLPVVIGKISDSGNNEAGKVWTYGELVQYGQEKYARLDKNAAIVRSTKFYKYSDRWHYDSAGYIDFGAQFAKAVYELKEK